MSTPASLATWLLYANVRGRALYHMRRDQVTLHGISRNIPLCDTPRYSCLWQTHLRATECHLPCEITLHAA